jgi:hypothetical protein
LGITIPTNGKYEDLIKLNYDEKKVKIKNIIQSWSKRSLTLFDFSLRLIKFVYRLHIETVLSLFFYNKTLLYLLIALWLFLEFLHIKEINRYIGDYIRSLLEVIDLTEEENLSCIVLSIDFEKAFDTISWKFKKKWIFHYRLIKFVYRLHIETVLSLFFYNKTLLYLLIVLWLFLEFLHIKEINKAFHVLFCQ